MNYKFLLLFSFLSFSFFQTSSQNVILSEDFNDCEYPADWQVNIQGGGTEVWYVGHPNNPNADGTTIDGSCMLVIDDDAAGDNTPGWVGHYRTPTFDGTQYATISFSVDVHHRDAGEQGFRIKVWDGNGYHTLKNYDEYSTGEQFSEFEHFTADLSFFAAPEMHILFEFDDGDIWGWWAGIDNVLVTGEGEGTNLVLESFDACGLPSGWSTEIISGIDDWMFGFIDNGNAWAANSLNGTCMAYFDDDGIGEFQPFSKVRLKSPFIDVTNYANVYLNFDLLFRKYAELESFSILVSDGATEKPVITWLDEVGDEQFNRFEHVEVDLSPYRSQQIQIIFQYDDGASWGWWIGMDNVKVTGEGSINDLCSTATEIQLNQTCQAGNNNNALTSGAPSNCTSSEEAQLWYRYEADFTGILSLETGADFNDAITVFEGDCNNLNYNTCNNYDEFGFKGEQYLFDVENGKTYFIRIGGVKGRFGTSKGDVCIKIEQANAYPDRPMNDPCQDPITLAIGDNCNQSMNLHAAFDQPVPSLNGRSRADVWYQFEANGNPLEFSTQADFADVITVYEGDCQTLSEIAGNEKGQKLKLEDLVAGQNYFVQVSGFFATLEGNLCPEIQELNIPTPNNDLCLDAISLNLGDNCLSASNEGSDFDGPIPSCIPNAASNIWFKFTAPSSGNIKFNTGATTPHTLSIFKGNCNNLEEVSCFKNPLRCNGYQIAHDLIPGEEYYLSLASSEFEAGMSEGEFCIQLLDGNDLTEYNPVNINPIITCTEPGKGVFTFDITGGQGQINLQGTASGTELFTGQKYLVVASDDWDCETSISGKIACGVPDCSISSTVSFENISCYGQNDGSASVSVTDAFGNLTYQWSNGANTASIENLSPGFYSVTTTDENNCPSVSEFTIYEPSRLSFNEQSSDENSYAANDGSINISPSGGTSPYTVNWENGSSGLSRNNLAPGNYAFTLTDDNGCKSNGSITIQAFECTLDASLDNQSNVSCFGEEDGALSVSTQGGTAPYTINWSTGETGTNIQNLVAGNYTVSITDANDCPVELNLEITEPKAIETDIVKMSESGFDTNDGFLHVNASGGTPPFTFEWQHGASGEELENLAPGNYTVTITDQNGCTKVQTITIDAFNCLVDLNEVISNVSCNGSGDGMIEVEMSGTGPFTFEWSNGSSGNVLNNLSPGTYDLTATDANNCPATASYTIDEPEVLEAIISDQTNVICPDDQNGSISLEGIGGTAPFEFYWLGGQTSASITDLSAGNYFATISDANGCEATFKGEILVTDDQLPVVKTKSTVVFLNENGEATLDASQVDNGSSDNCGIESLSLDKTNFDCNDLGNQDLKFSAQDINGNMSETMVNVLIRDTIRPQFNCPESQTLILCDAVYEYEIPEAMDNCSVSTLERINGPESGEKLPLGLNTFTFKATDQSGNESTCTWEVNLVDTLLQTSYQIEKPACNGDFNGQIEAMVEGGSGNYTYLWNSGASGAQIFNIGVGIYAVTISDNAACERVDTISVPEPAAIAVNIDSIFKPNNGLENGKIEITISGGTSPYSLSWTNTTTGQTYQNEDPDQIAAGNYNLSITDVNGCMFVMENIIVDEASSIQSPSYVKVLNIFPNPAEAIIFVEAEALSCKKADIRIYDMEGKLMFQAKDQSATGKRLKIDVQRLAAGQYSLEVLLDKEIIRGSFAKMKS
ncbi:MAG: T9SS type A sorting domain-containing protein [Saprospiraceae bacterium]